MIRLERVTKTFYKGKSNEHIVTNAISLTLPDAGLVAILGESGSGKTTLLNLLSGMDKFDSGKIVFGDEIITKYRHRQWDAIRKHRIGYVHQNFHLMKEQSVYANIEPILRMQGMTLESDRKQRVDQLLHAVGLRKYADRLVKQLSGGQQQRVAFARALANNPEVILADEPTGNLDGKTTIELMNLIQEIAKSRLVVLVTHERYLCEYYADRIIEMANGSIVSDVANAHRGQLKILQEHIIELQGMKKTILNGEDLEVRRYSDSTLATPLSIDLIERNRTLYLKIRSANVLRTKTIAEDSEIVLKDGTESLEHEPLRSVLEERPAKLLAKPNQNVFTWRDIFRYAVPTKASLRGSGRFLLFVLMVVGLIVGISIGVVGEIFHVEEPFSVVDRNYITVHMERSTYQDALAIEALPGVDHLMLFSQPIAFRIVAEPFYEIRTSIPLEAVPIDIRFFNPETLLYGTLPAEYEIVIDISVADEIIRANRIRGIEDYDDVLRCSFKLQTNGIDIDLAADSALTFAISGIADNNSQSVWMKEELLYSLVTPYLIDYRVLGDGFVVESGALPDSSTYVMLNDHFPTVRLGSIPYNIGIETGTYYVSGIYRYEIDGTVYNLQNAMVTNLEYIKNRLFTYTYSHAFDYEILVYASDVETTLQTLIDHGYMASANRFQPAAALRAKIAENFNFYILALGGLLISALSIYLIMRSSLISRIHEITVFRSIGVSRPELRRIFFLEIAFRTSYSSVLGYGLMVALLQMASVTFTEVTITRFGFGTVLIGLAALYLINFLFGMVPVLELLAKTPSSLIKDSDM